MPIVDDRDVIINQGRRPRFGFGRAWRLWLGLGLLLAALVLLLALAGTIRQALDPVAREQAQWAAYDAQARAERLRWAYDAAAVGWQLLPLGAGLVGLLALYRWLAERSGRDRFYEVQAARWRHQPGQTPHTLTYSPHSDYQQHAPAQVLGPPLDEPAPPALPGITDLAALGFRPTKDAILLGLGPNNERITVPVNRLWHIATAGPTGNGKSNIHRMLLAQLLALGARVTVGDPKWTPYDIEQDEDWRPIADRLYLEPAATAGAIGELLDWGVDELQQRLQRRREQQPVGPPLFITLDELPWIADNVKGSTDAIGELVRLGRGVGLFLLCAAQDFLVKTVDLSAARDNFRSAFYLGGDLKTGSVLLDMPQRDLAAREGAFETGVALLRSSATTPAQLVRVPYASNQALYQLLGTSPGTSPGASPETAGGRWEVGGEVAREVGAREVLPAASDARNPRAERVRAMLLRKCSQNEIISAVWGATGGKSYQQAADEYREILARLAGGE